MYNHIYDIFKHWTHPDENGKPRGSIYLYSDPHFCDDEMKYLRKNYIGDDEQVKRINSKVGKLDTTIFLGDIGNKDNILEALEFVKKIRGYKVLVMGNHDKGETLYKRKTEEIKVPFSFPKDISGPSLDYAKNYPNGSILIESGQRTKLDNDYILKNFKNRFSSPDYQLEYAKQGEVKISYDTVIESWVYYVHYDNHLFDEVYSGPIIISDKIVLSHEPVFFGTLFNIHGHEHGRETIDNQHLNVCAEQINYLPVRLKDIIESGKIANIITGHRQTIDKATARKKKKNK